MKNGITIVVVAILVVANISSLVNTSRSNAEIKQLISQANTIPSKVVYVQAKDGYTPVKGIDYFDGTNGMNSISFVQATTVVKEVPLIGEKGADGEDGADGKDGIDAPFQESRFNTATGNYETKLSTSRFWDIAIPCDKFVAGCGEQ